MFRFILGFFLIAPSVLAAADREIEHMLFVDVSGSLFYPYAKDVTEATTHPHRRIDVVNLSLMYVFQGWSDGRPVSVFDWAEKTAYVGASPKMLAGTFSQRWENTPNKTGHTYMAQAIDYGATQCNHYVFITDGIISGPAQMQAAKERVIALAQHGYVTLILVPFAKQEKGYGTYSAWMPASSRYQILRWSSDATENAALSLARVGQVEQDKDRCLKVGL